MVESVVHCTAGMARGDSSDTIPFFTGSNFCYRIVRSAWVDKFVSEHGIEQLMAPLQVSGGASVETCNEVLSTIFVLINSSNGAEAVAKMPEFCSLLYSVFDCSSSNEVRARLLKMMGILSRENCTVRDAVISVFSSESLEDRYLQLLVNNIKHNQSDLFFQLAAVKLLNILLETTRNRKQQTSICEDLKANGLLPLLEVFKNRDISSEDESSMAALMVAHVKIFFKLFDEATSENKLGALRSALGDVLNSNCGESRKLNMPREPAQGNQGESDYGSGPANPEQELADEGRSTGTDTAIGAEGQRSASDKTRSGTLDITGESATRLDDVNSTMIAVAQSSLNGTLLDDVFSQLQQHSKNLDQQTNEKLANLLQTITTTLSNDSSACLAFNQLEKSLLSNQDTNTKQSELEASVKVPNGTRTVESKEPDLFTRVGMALFPNMGESVSSGSKPPTTGRPTLFPSFGDFSLASLTASTPVKNSISKPSFSNLIGADTSASPWSRPVESSTPRGVKLSLPFFQSSRKGPGFGVTPACTPIATASVRKDAKRPVFPSFPSPRKEVPPALSPLQASTAVPPTTTFSPVPGPTLPPIDIEPNIPTLNVVVKPLTLEPDMTGPNASPATGTEISKFRKLLSMGAPREAVRSKMLQAGLNPDLLDEQQGFTPIVSPKLSTLKIATLDIPKEVALGADVAKFRKLLSMGAPLEAVKAKMCQAGIDPNLLNENTNVLPVTKGPAPALASVPESVSGPDISKFKKLLAMGAPLIAVKAKMTQAGLNPALLDGSNNMAVSDSLISPTSSSLKVKDDPSYAKFFKLLSMGAPAAAVKAKMVQAGLNGELLDTPDAAMSTSGIRSDFTPPLLAAPIDPRASLSNLLPTRSTSASQPEAQMKVKDDPQYSKFFKLLSMGAPAESVKAKMRMAGLLPDLLDTPDAPLPSSSNLSGMEVSQEIKVKDDPAYSKFFKLLSMGAPPESVKAKMCMAGLKPELLDTPDANMPNTNATTEASKSAVKVKDDPAYAKFFKLLSMGAPAESVKAKMQMAGLKPELLDTPDADLPSENNQFHAQSPMKVKDDPAYAKFFKLLEMGAPPESVKAKMRMAGLQGDLLDTPNAVLPNSAPTNQPVAATPTTAASRRAHLSIAIKPVVKAKTRAFYWQHLKAEAIKGTIWEELEQEQSNQCNQDRLTLTESELELLETEFPPPAACGPSTGSRRGSMSGIGSPGCPASPLASPRIVFLIDRARSNNISIIFKQFKMSNAALRVAIMKMDSEVLTLDRVQGLIKILPTDEEIAAITGFSGDPTTLNGAELVLKELITVPRLKQRLSALETKHQFPALVRDLQTKINKIRVASNEIAQSSELKTILLVILQIGNKMNHGTARGGAKGFRLNDLTKLVQLKSVDKSITLLHYVARMIRSKKGNVVRLGDSLASLYDVQSIPIPELQGDMNRINDITENINVELAAQRLKNRIEEKEENDMFVESMTVFVDEAAKEVTNLKRDLDETLRLMRDIMLRFDKNTEEEESQAPASDASLTPASLAGAGEFFSIIYEFTMSLMKADRENELKRIREEKRLKQQELKNATPRRNSVDRAALKKLGSTAGSEAQDTPRRKSTIAAVNSESFTSKGISSLLPGVCSEAHANEVPKSEASPASITLLEAEAISDCQEAATEALRSRAPKVVDDARSAMSNINEVQKTKVDVTTDGKIVPKPSGIPKPALKTPGKITTGASVASPLKKAVGAMPTGIPGPMKLKRANSSFSSIEKSTTPAVAFDAASLSEVKSLLKTKHSANNELRALKPEVETEGEDNDNNNSESSSPEKAQSEAEPSTRKGLRGFIEGGIFTLSTPLSCAEHCVTDQLCLSFDFETVSRDCYISHTDRFAHPEAYLDFPTGVYYEWQGIVDAPEIEPNGGLFNTQIAVRLLTAKLGAGIYYKVIPSTALASTNLTVTGLFGTGQNYSITTSGNVVILPTYSCKIFAIAVKQGMDDSVLVVSNEYHIFPSKYAYLVPYFNGEYHGRVARIELDLKGKKRPRPARFLEFSDYETPNGVGPYDEQVNVIDMASLDPEFKGFYSGFTAFSKTTFVNETYLVPAADDPNYQTTHWRVTLKALYTPSPTHSGFGIPSELEQDVEFLYMVPFYNGTTFTSKILRVMALTFSLATPIIEVLDVGALDSSLRGFGSSFTDGFYGYLVPRENENGLFGKLVRFRINNFTATSVEVLDLVAIHPHYMGFKGDELTTNLREFPVSNSGLIVRVDLNTFSVAGSLDLSTIHPDLCGFSGAVTVTHFAYFVPYMRVREPDSQELNPYSGLVGRVDLRDFTSVHYLNLTTVDSGLRGFMKGFAYRQYVFLVPHRTMFYDRNGRTQSGKVARIDTNDFSPTGVSFLDLTTALRSQVPDFADSDLRGFSGGVASGKYGFFVPYFNGATFSGKVCRINLDKFDEVQTLDLTQFDTKLRGFADGILSHVEEELEADLFAEFQIRLGTTDPYEYHY
ncbi:unnamed protein product [Phytophthora fragariaefolia]|uniref:Unnamed protein product n=1 Tax=Phytophthora fragariaefolia TaxID=1490495 RepID=A0A9W6Y5N8_9STRA|nr:unnamed protein product [Phytophthora fragariaefolia]